MSDVRENTSNQFSESEEKLINLYEDRLHHGFGEIVVFIKTGKNDKREVMIKSGRFYKYMIPEDQIDKREE
jgi:hypothetical protein